MELRPALMPPPVSDAALSELGAEIDRVADLYAAGAPGAGAALAAFNERTGHDYQVGDLVGYDGSRSRDDLAREAARPPWPRVPDVSRDELVEIVRRIMATDADQDWYLLLFETNTPHPAASGLIFHGDATAAEIVDQALAYRPAAL